MKTLVPLYGRMNDMRGTTKIFSKTILFLNVFSVLLALQMLSGHFGFVTSPLSQISTVYLLFGVILLNVPLRDTLQALRKKTPHLITLLLGIVLCSTGFILLVLSKSQVLLLASIPVILSGLSFWLQALKHRRNELDVLTVFSFVYAFVFLLLQTVPFLWNVYQQSSLTISHAVGLITAVPLLLGPTTSGLGIVLVTFLFIISVFFLFRNRPRKTTLRLAVSIGMLSVIWVSYLVLLSLKPYSSGEAISLHPVFFLFCLIPAFMMLYEIPGLEPTTEWRLPREKNMKRFLKNGAVWAAVFLFLSTMFLIVFLHTGLEPDSPQKVIFYGKNMVGTWDVPGYGRYGKDAVGMFGLWPVYLTMLGYETELVVENKTRFIESISPVSENITNYLDFREYTTVIETEQITRPMLDNAAVFVVSNLNASFSKQEHLVIWEYIANGGSLLVIGDHTNVGGIQTPLNDLLAPVGVRFRFDAALPLDEQFKWLSCVHLLHHPITAPLPSIHVLQYGIGASLDIPLTAVPIVIGDSALSDAGDPLNEDIAYLGDYEYNKGEHLGDVVLVAGAFYGNGKVLVFGDTSTFQNPALPFSFSFLSSTFTWLTSTHTVQTTTFQIGGSLLLLLAAVLVYRFFRKKTTTFAIFPFVLCMALLFSPMVTPLLGNTLGVANPENLVLIDSSHGERFSLNSFTGESINGLIVNLQRNNLLPVLLREFSEEKILASKLLIFNAPTKAFTSEEVTFLRSYMADGGIVLLATGYDDKETSLPLLKTFNVDIGQTPLGPVPYVEGNLTYYQNEPRFVDSWPLSFPKEQALSYYNFTWQNFSFHLVVFLQHGAGGLLVISDSQYLLDKNLESVYDYWPGNILFLKYLLEEVLSKEDLR